MTVVTFESASRRGAQILVNSARGSVVEMPKTEMVEDLMRVLERYRTGSYDAEIALSYVAAVATVGLERALEEIAARVAHSEAKAVPRPCI